MKRPGPKESIEPRDPRAFKELPTAADAYACEVAEETIAYEAVMTD